MQMNADSGSRIIVFASYRDTVKEIASALGNVTSARPVEFIGQREGVTQKEQVKRLKEFSKGTYNVLVATSIGEETRAGHSQTASR